jgi:hypothetical protein
VPLTPTSLSFFCMAPIPRTIIFVLSGVCAFPT